MYCTVLFTSPENSCYSIKGLLIEDALEQKYSVIGKLKYFINNSYTSREEISHLSIFFFVVTKRKKESQNKNPISGISSIYPLCFKFHTNSCRNSSQIIHRPKFRIRFFLILL